MEKHELAYMVRQNIERLRLIEKEINDQLPTDTPREPNKYIGNDLPLFWINDSNRKAWLDEREINYPNEFEAGDPIATQSLRKFINEQTRAWEFLAGI